jgi:hypothetical protein
MLLNGGTFEGRRYLKPETVALMASDHISPETSIARADFYNPGAGSGFELGFAVRTEVPPNICRTSHGLWANTARTASPALSSSSIPKTTCLRSSWCRPRRSAAGFSLS